MIQGPRASRVVVIAATSCESDPDSIPRHSSSVFLIFPSGLGGKKNQLDAGTMVFVFMPGQSGKKKMNLSCAIYGRTQWKSLVFGEKTSE